jgi:hypothetical protein
MKRRWIKRGLWILSAILATLIALAEVLLIYRDQAQKLMDDYLNQQLIRSTELYGTKLPQVDEVRLVRFTDTRTASLQRVIDIPLGRPSQGYVVAEKVIAGREAMHLAELWRSFTFTENHTGCYSPHHVIEFRIKGRTICEAVVCFHCDNTSLPSFPRPVLVNVWDMASNEAGQGRRFKEFQALVEQSVGSAP